MTRMGQIAQMISDIRTICEIRDWSVLLIFSSVQKVLP